jgi:hypothetical protein
VGRFDYVLLLSRWFHLAAAIVAIGGAAYARWAVLPAAQEVLDDAARARLHEAVRRRWLRVVLGCIAVLLVTGGINFVTLAMPPKIDPIPYHPIFGVKFLAALLIFFVASALVGRSPGLEAIRRHRAKSLNIILATAAVIILLSGVLSQIRLVSRPTDSRALAAP